MNSLEKMEKVCYLHSTKVAVTEQGITLNWKTARLKWEQTTSHIHCHHRCLTQPRRVNNFHIANVLESTVAYKNTQKISQLQPAASYAIWEITFQTPQTITCSSGAAGSPCGHCLGARKPGLVTDRLIQLQSESLLSEHSLNYSIQVFTSHLCQYTYIHIMLFLQQFQLQLQSRIHQLLKNQFCVQSLCKHKRISRKNPN